MEATATVKTICTTRGLELCTCRNKHLQRKNRDFGEELRDLET